MATIQDATGTFTADVTSDSELSIALTKILANAGYAIATGEQHDGSSGAAALRRSIGVSSFKRIKAGMDNSLWDDVFNHTILNSRKYIQAATTMAAAVASGYLALNSGNSVATATGIIQRTYKSFPLWSEQSISIDITFALSVVPQANNEIYLGVGIPNTAVTVPLDGLYMFWTNTGAFQLVANNNGSIVTSGNIAFTWTAGRMYDSKILIQRNRVELYIDDVLYASLSRPTSLPNGNSLSLNNEGYLFGQIRNTAATGAAQQLRIGSWGVQNRDVPYQMPVGDFKTLQGEHSIAVPDSVAVGNTNGMGNSTVPASATLSNTAAGYTTLGGHFQFASVAGAETDFALFAYQVPANGVSLVGKGFVVTGVELTAWNTGAANGAAIYVLNWFLGIGSTAVSLATADAVTTKAPQRFPLGAMTLANAAAIGTLFTNPISSDFSAMKLMVNPGEFIHIILRIPTGVLTASQIIRGLAGVKGFWL